MARTLQNTRYQAFGFQIASEIPMPELLPPSGNEKRPVPDIEIELSNLTGMWLQNNARYGKFNLISDGILFQIPDIATFFIQDGKKIVVSPADGSDMDEIRLYILGTCMGGILLQRRVLPLHGSAIAIDGKAYAVVGESGAGKSTTSTALLNEGYQLLTDDVIAVTIQPGGQTPIVTPSYPQQKLWQESLEQFGRDSSGYRPLGQRETKFSVPVKSSFCAGPLPLAGIFELVKSGKPEIELKKISRLESLPLLYRHTFRNMLVRRLGLTGWHLDTTAMLANQLNVFRLERPDSSFTAAELASLIVTTVMREKVYS
ncbi:aldolase [Paenibacillus sp. LHD-117]|uniref:aldolase n=1 Tax=Paenibacillus sp. LHD-117 TaxID=3071412 RepID=UPI0027E14DFF|nr:aldolase [Paenibacillus sp. LHD-117]MDQ6422356.1 aldolase [Paenibacillus sp. LHD-117]